jgi:hypothetical protein
MTDAVPHHEHRLEVFSDTFVTFLYAASIHLIVAHLDYESLTMLESVGVLLIILFLLSDWLSRMRLPRLLRPGDEMSIAQQLFKTIFEVGGLYFLVVAWMMVVEEFGPAATVPVPTDPNVAPPFWDEHLTAERAFALFLIATSAWNLLMLRVMRSLKSFLLCGVNGTALDSEAMQKYGTRFYAFWQSLETEVTTTKNGSAIPSELKRIPLAIRAAVLQAVVRQGAQIPIIHIAWTNLAAAAILLIQDHRTADPTIILDAAKNLSLLHHHGATRWLLGVAALAMVYFTLTSKNHGKPLFLFFLSLLAVMALAWQFTEVFIVGLVLGIPVFFFFLACCSDRRQWKTICHACGGVLGSAGLSVFYLIHDSRQLLFYVAAQQVLVNVFLQYAAYDHSRRHKAPAVSLVVNQVVYQMTMQPPDAPPEDEKIS